jgi:hypothetical protein
MSLSIPSQPESTSDPLEAVRSQAGFILEQMEAQRTLYLGEAVAGIRKPDLSFQFDNKARLLAEMPVCGFVYQEGIQAPEGFGIFFGNIRVEGQDTPPMTHVGHYVWFNPKTDEIACLAFAQYAKFYDTNTIPGDRLNELIKKAPHLIREVVPGLHLLYGNRRQVYWELGLAYELTHKWT